VESTESQLPDVSDVAVATEEGALLEQTQEAETAAITDVMTLIAAHKPSVPARQEDDEISSDDLRSSESANVMMAQCPDHSSFKVRVDDGTVRQVVIWEFEGRKGGQKDEGEWRRKTRVLCPHPSLFEPNGHFIKSKAVEVRGTHGHRIRAH